MSLATPTDRTTTSTAPSRIRIDPPQAPTRGSTSNVYPWKRYLFPILLLGSLIAIPLAGYRYWWNTEATATDAVTHTVARSNLNVKVTERGNLESQKTIDGTCELKGYENKIIFIVEEGTEVAKDDIVVRFDNSVLERNIAEQEIQVNQAKGDVDTKRQEVEVQRNQNESDISAAELELALARLDLVKYKEGDYTVQLNELKGMIALAEFELDKATTALQNLEELVKSGIRQPEQLQGARQSVEHAKFNHRRDVAKLDVLEKFEYERSLTEFQGKADEAERKLARAKASAAAQLSKAESALAASEAALRMQEKRYQEFVEQLAKCEIRAQQDGIVAYANREYWDESRLIREGATVHERQTIFRLPDMSQMQVKVNVHESVIKKVKPGQKATVRVDAFPDVALIGVVNKVSPLADSSNVWASGGVKEYTTYVVIDDIMDVPLRPGMTAEVEIDVGQRPQVVAVPVQAVTAHAKKHYAFVATPKGFDARPVDIGESNYQMVEVKSGLEPGEIVALDARNRAIAQFGESELDDTEATETPTETATVSVVLP